MYLNPDPYLAKQMDGKKSTCRDGVDSTHALLDAVDRISTICVDIQQML